MRFDIIRLFSLGYAKDYAKDKPSTLEHLKTNIRQVMAEIPPNMCQKMVENYVERTNACNMCQKVVENYLEKINACNTSRGVHLNDFTHNVNVQTLQ